jgi:hypothetical protein
MPKTRSAGALDCASAGAGLSAALTAVNAAAPMIMVLRSIVIT